MKRLVLQPWLSGFLVFLISMLLLLLLVNPVWGQSFATPGLLLAQASASDSAEPQSPETSSGSSAQTEPQTAPDETVPEQNKMGEEGSDRAGSTGPYDMDAIRAFNRELYGS